MSTLRNTGKPWLRTLNHRNGASESVSWEGVSPSKALKRRVRKVTTENGWRRTTVEGSEEYTLRQPFSKAGVVVPRWVPTTRVRRGRVSARALLEIGSKDSYARWKSRAQVGKGGPRGTPRRKPSRPWVIEKAKTA